MTAGSSGRATLIKDRLIAELSEDCLAGRSEESR